MAEITVIEINPVLLSAEMVAVYVFLVSKSNRVKFLTNFISTPTNHQSPWPGARFQRKKMKSNMETKEQRETNKNQRTSFFSFSGFPIHVRA